MTNTRNSRIRNFRFFGTLVKSAVALALVGGLTVATGASGASASNGASKSSDRSHESHDEHEKDHDGIGHGDDDDHKGRGRGHDSHGNGHGYGHGDGCEDHDESDGHDETSDDVVPSTTTAPTSTVPATGTPEAGAPETGTSPVSEPLGSVDRSNELVIDADTPVDEQNRAPQFDAVETNETTVPALQPSATGDNLNAPAGNVATEPGANSPGTPERGRPESGTPESGTIVVTDNLPMTGTSLVLAGMAIALAVAGVVVLVARRRREQVVS